MKTGILSGASQIELERLRQIEEKGYTPEHGLQFTAGELVASAASLLLNRWAVPTAVLSASLPCVKHVMEKYAADPIRWLAIAGAFIAAEIDRLELVDARRKNDLDKAWDVGWLVDVGFLHVDGGLWMSTPNGKILKLLTINSTWWLACGVVDVNLGDRLTRREVCELLYVLGMRAAAQKGGYQP